MICPQALLLSNVCLHQTLAVGHIRLEVQSMRSLVRMNGVPPDWLMQIHGLEESVLTEAIVRESLRHDLLAHVPSAEAVYEFWVPRTYERADVAVIGPTMDGFEIKTERDNLKRLPRQAAAYSRLFDRCYVVLADRHVGEAIEMLPPWWGMILIRGEAMPAFERLREAGINHDVDPETLVRLLWRNEVYSVLCALGAPPEPKAGRFRMWEELLDLADIDMLKSVVRQTLIRRDPNLARISSRRFTVNQTLGLAARRRGADDVMFLLPASVLASLVPQCRMRSRRLGYRPM